MAGRVEDSFDTPNIAPKSRYIQRARRTRIGRGARIPGVGGSSTVDNITYLENVTINGATITGNVTVDAGITIDGRDISADGTTLDSHATILAGLDTANRVVVTDGSNNLDESAITSTELTYLNDVTELTTVAPADNQGSAADVATWAHATFDSIFIDYSISRGSANKEIGRILICTDGTSASISNNNQTVGSPGVTFSVDVSGANVRLRYTSTSTGTAPSFKYTAQKWLA